MARRLATFEDPTNDSRQGRKDRQGELTFITSSSWRPLRPRRETDFLPVGIGPTFKHTHISGHRRAAPRHFPHFGRSTGPDKRFTMSSHDLPPMKKSAFTLIELLVV